METFVLDETKIETIVDAILNKINYSKFILLRGDLGTGKTTLAKLLLKKLGVDVTITSPTFNIISEYISTSNSLIYHIDFYRLNSIEELFEIGFDEIIDSGNICIIEWPELAMPLLQLKRLEINISHFDEKRKYNIETL